ncbi:hypothetical protein ACFL6X_01350 [Candidatus Latescibacterota bacterium]
MPDLSNGEGFEALEKRCQRLLCERDALALVRQQVADLRSPEDLDELLEAVGESLRTAGIAFQDYSLNTIDRSTDPPIMGWGGWRWLSRSARSAPTPACC